MGLGSLALRACMFTRFYKNAISIMCSLQYFLSAKVNWVFYVPEVLHSLESNSQVANSAPDLSDQIAISTRAINARAKAAFALDDSEHMIHHDTS